MDYMKNFAENIKQIRLANGYNQRYVAEQVNLTLANYQNIETGKSIPKLNNAVKLADLYNVSIDSLLGRKID